VLERNISKKKNNKKRIKQKKTKIISYLNFYTELGPNFSVLLGDKKGDKCGKKTLERKNQKKE
jgi:hypothetical protein